MKLDFITTAHTEMYTLSNVETGEGTIKVICLLGTWYLEHPTGWLLVQDDEVHILDELSKATGEVH